MALHPNFAKSPYAILDPSIRWFPADEALREQGYEKLLPPLVTTLRRKVKEWRESGYEGARATSLALLRWWFQKEHPTLAPDGTTFDFQYYFAQREAIETIIYLHEVANVQDKYDLLRFDSSGAVSAGMFPESDELNVQYISSNITERATMPKIKEPMSEAIIADSSSPIEY